MTRILITSLAFCLMLLSTGKSFAIGDTPVSDGGHDVMSMHPCDMAMAETCNDMDSSTKLFSHFHCHLNVTCLITDYSSISLSAPPSSDYKYRFSSKVHIETLTTKPPQFT